MTDYAADGASEAGTTTTQRTGTASSDTVPGGSRLLIQNTGAGSHNFDLTITATWHGLSPGSAGAPGKRRVVVGNGAWAWVYVPNEMADANGRVAVAIDGTPGEVKYHVLGV